jgi:hypothetical protein
MGKPDPSSDVGAGNLLTPRREERSVGGGGDAPKWNGELVLGVQPDTGHALSRTLACGDEEEEEEDGEPGSLTPSSGTHFFFFLPPPDFAEATMQVPVPVFASQW